jgi:L-rhamnose-H+ transport protein
MSALIGVGSAVLSGACDGSYGVVMKITKKWEWENIWLLFSISALGVFPLILALWCIPDLMSVYRESPTAAIWATALFGTGWGIGSVCFGLGLYLLGQSIAYTVMMGIIAVGGALAPMLATNSATALTSGGLLILMSMVVMIAGVAFCGFAGKLRDESAAATSVDPVSGKNNFAFAFLVCLAGGVFSSMFNLAFHYGSPIAVVAAKQLGESSSSFRANSPIWALAMLGGFVPNLLYCVYLLNRRGTWAKFRQSQIGVYWFWAIVMGALFAAGITCYGVGASNLGRLGTTVAWLVFVSTGILVANVWGVVCGEWTGAPTKAIRRMRWGSTLLLISIGLVSYGNHLLP